MSRKDIAGVKFGKMLAVKPAPDYVRPNGERITQWLCVCECGNTRVIRQSNLLSGHTSSCGCGRKRKKGPGIKYCVYHPTAVDCTELNCHECGWNPYNKVLRNKRLMKLKRKVGTDE